MTEQGSLAGEIQRDLLRRGFSRRYFGRVAMMMAGGAVALPFYNEPALAQRGMRQPLPPDAVFINQNENPLGPCPEALDAIYAVARKGGRYGYDEYGRFARLQADLEGLKPDYVQPYAGSSPALHQAVMAFTSPQRALVMGEPGYEAPERSARFVGAKVVKVPLAKSYAHDVKAMVAAAPAAGVFYVCNPNNPTGTLTPRADIEWLVANKPAGSIVLLDEAYIHFPGVSSASDLVVADKDVIVLRTFSKLYGMAGLRAGAALGRPDLIAKLPPYGTGFLPVTGLAGATASLNVADRLVPERRKYVAQIREDVSSWLASKNIGFVPSVSNKMMIDCKRPGGEVFEAMLAEKVVIGRTWPCWPNHVRVTVGTAEEMARFKTAFAKVMAV